MILMLAVVFWLTIAGANVPSAMLAELLVDQGPPGLKGLGATIGMPWWLSGLLFDGVYLATAWVIAVMLPPMAIFFPLFTLLEDFGYLPRVAFNLDALFRRVGAHGKQALTMCMGFGCNAAGVVATRVIDSPRERLVAIITNNFSLCNGRWPTQILMATIFIGALAPPALAGLVSAPAVVAVALLGVVLHVRVSWLLTRTVLRGEATSFSPRAAAVPAAAPLADAVHLAHRPHAHRALARDRLRGAGGRRDLADRERRARAATASRRIWSGASTRSACCWAERRHPARVRRGDPGQRDRDPDRPHAHCAGRRHAGCGAGAGVMFELDQPARSARCCARTAGPTLTAVNLMLFSLLHNPCSTTIYTI